MPLSEHEQRMLRQIERQFQQERGLARSLHLPADPREASRNAKRAFGGFLVGLALVLVSLASSWVVGLVGFLVMLATALVVVQCLRRLAQDRWGLAPGTDAAQGAEGPPSGRHRPGWGADGQGHQDDERH